MKDLTQYLNPGLDLKCRDKVYHVPPPSKDVGLKLAAINALGIAAVVGKEAIEQLPVEQRDLALSLVNVDLAELSLGSAFQQMVNDEMPSPDVDTYGLYAFYYWTLGEAAADDILAEINKGADPKAAARKRSKSGRSTGSGNRTRTASTRTTGSRTTSDPAE